MSPIDHLLRRLRAPNPATRRDAARQLEARAIAGLSWQEGAKLLRAAVEPGRDAGPHTNGSRMLLELLLARPDPRFVPIVCELYSLYDRDTRGAALTLLAAIGTRPAIASYLELVRSHGLENDSFLGQVGAFSQHLRHAELLFPDLLECQSSPAGLEPYMILLAYCQAGAVCEERRLACEPALLRGCRALRQQLNSWRRSPYRSWRWDEGYATPRHAYGLLLDCLGHIPSPAACQELTLAANLDDPRLAYFAALSLLRLDATLPPDALANVAASDEMRAQLHHQLEAIDRLDLFPRQWQAPEHLARSAFVAWVTTTSLRREPEEVELMATLDRRESECGAAGTYYVFRFRMHGAHALSPLDWMAGASGPEDTFEAASPFPGSEGWSCFERWNDRSAEEHLERMLQRLAAVRERRPKLPR